MDSEYFKDSKNVLKLIFFSILILFFTTQVIDVTLGHFLAIIIVVSSVSYYLSTEADNSVDLLNKLNYIRDSEIPVDNEYMYLDSELIELFYSVKIDLYKYNNKAIDDSIKACNNLLKLRRESELKLLPRPKPVNNTINSLEELEKSLIPDNKFEPLVNGYAVFEAANIQYKLCLNHMQSLVVNLPANPVLRDKLNAVLEKLNILLKRNLDTIYYAYKDHRKDYQTDITNYDLYESYVPSDTVFNFFA